MGTKTALSLVMGIRANINIGVVLGGMCIALAFQNCSEVAFNSSSPIDPFSAIKCVAASAPELEPVEKFRWDYAHSTAPEYHNVMSTPAVGDIDGDKVPEIVFTSYAADYKAAGILRVISGRDGKELRSLNQDSLAPKGDAAVLIIDIDRNKTAEIIYVHYSSRKVIALNYDLSTRWVYELGPTDESFLDCLGGPAAGDLNGDGLAEIIVENLVIEEAPDHSVTARRLGPYQKTNCTTFAISADPQAPDKMQVVTGAGVFRYDGSALFEMAISNGTRGRRLAVANLDSAFPGLELVYIDTGRIHAYNISTQQELWPSISLTSDANRFEGKVGDGGPPTIADFTGDGKPDIAVAGAVFYSIYDQKGNLLWQKETNDYSSQITGSSSFDFNGDGISEVLYADEGYLRIFNGPTGDVLFQIPNPSHTHLEYPVVVDVDADGHSELLLAGNTASLAASRWETDPVKLAAILAAGPGIKVYGARNAEKWVPTRSVWNQYSYFVQNVNDDLTATAFTPIGAGNELEVFRQNKLSLFDKNICINDQN